MTTEAVAEIASIDEYGPCLTWHKHWAEVGIGTKLFASPAVAPVADNKHDAEHLHYRPALIGAVSVKPIEWVRRPIFGGDDRIMSYDGYYWLSREGGELPRVSRTEILREWFGGDRFGRDYEYIDANFGKQADRVVAYLAALSAQDTDGVAQLGASSEHDLQNTLKSVLHHFGPEGAGKVTRDVLGARPGKLT